MKYALIAAAMAAAMALIVYLFGMSLPRNHTSAVTRDFPVPPDRLFAVITNYKAHPQWRTGLKRVNIDPSGKGYTEHGEWAIIPMNILEQTTPSKLVTEIASDDLGFGGTWTFEITPQLDGSSRLTITERGFVPSPIFRFLSKFVFGHEKTLRTYQEDLARHLAK